LGDTFSAPVQMAIDNYEYVLEKLKHSCDEHRARLLFVYFPAYSQIYDQTASLHINRVLAAACARLGIDFLDLTEAFREHGRTEVLHLAPIDYHLTPRGNRLFAAVVADHLLQSGYFGAHVRSVARSLEKIGEGIGH